MADRNEQRQLISALRGFEAFAGCSKGDVSALVEAGSRFALPTDWPLVQEGVPADACYVITDGQARVFAERTQIAELGPGDIVGEMTLFGGGQRRATVSSSSRISGLRVENDALRAVLKKHAALERVFEQAGSARSS